METKNTEKQKFKLTAQHLQGAGAVTVIVVIVVAILALTPGINLFGRTAPGAEPENGAQDAAGAQEDASGGQQYTLTYNAAGSGVLEAYIVGEDDEDMGSFVQSGAVIEEGKMLFFTANPDYGFLISRWQVNGVDTEGSGHILILPGITGDTSVTVQFEEGEVSQ